MAAEMVIIATGAVVADRVLGITPLINQLIRTKRLVVRTQSTEKPRQRICRLDTSSPDELREICDSVPRFGPFYSQGESLRWTGKEEAWNHVLRRSTSTEAFETIGIYLSAMETIELQARDTYADDSVDHLTGNQFRWMMIRDGCFILQLALFVLGGSARLGHPPDDPIFGSQRNTKITRSWIKYMFFVGNQIPLVVLKELMKQSFFQQVIETGKWDQPQDSLFKRALYEFLVFPSLNKRLTHWALLPRLYQKLGYEWTIHMSQQQQQQRRQQPSDLLHGLHMLDTGPESDDTYEAENEEGQGYREDGDIEDFADYSTIRSAMELKQAGISFKNSKGMGTRGIKFTTNMFRATLTLPTFSMDDDTEVLFRYLKNYEITQPLGRNYRDVCSYLQFMSELIRTPDDAKILASQGIIRANPKQREKLPGILNRLACGDTNHNLRIVRLQIDEYSRPPWEKVKHFLSLVLLLTFVQTVYTILGYYKKRRAVTRID